jgi:hypothetical protein
MRHLGALDSVAARGDKHGSTTPRLPGFPDDRAPPLPSSAIGTRRPQTQWHLGLFPRQFDTVRQKIRRNGSKGKRVQGSDTCETFFNGLCVITNFYDSIQVKASMERPSPSRFLDKLCSNQGTRHSGRRTTATRPRPFRSPPLTPCLVSPSPSSQLLVGFTRAWPPDPSLATHRCIGTRA